MDLRCSDCCGAFCCWADDALGGMHVDGGPTCAGDYRGLHCCFGSEGSIVISRRQLVVGGASVLAAAAVPALPAARAGSVPFAEIEWTVSSRIIGYIIFKDGTAEWFDGEPI